MHAGGSDRQLHAAGHSPDGVRGRVHPHSLGRATASTYLTYIYTPKYTHINQTAYMGVCYLCIVLLPYM